MEQVNKELMQLALERAEQIKLSCSTGPTEEELIIGE